MSSKMSIAASLESHMRFICPECGDEHVSQSNWRRHLNEEHRYASKKAEDFDFKEMSEHYHECQVCKKWVANAKNAIALLQYHRFLHLPYSRTYRCRHCPGAFARKRNLCEHLYRFHGRLIGRLEKEKKFQQAAQLAALNDPKKNKEFYLRFLCPQCAKQFDRFEQWVGHINTAHNLTSTDLRMHKISNTKNNYCLQCKKLFYTNDKAKLQRHRFTHLPHKSYFKCAHCPVKKTYKSEVLRHFIRVHRKEFEEAKQYIVKPEEWGGHASDRVHKELNELLGSNRRTSLTTSKPLPNKEEGTDLIQKALLDSLIDLENETAMDEYKQPPSKSANEFALDQSLNDLEDILRGDIILKQRAVPLISRDHEQNDFEELCADIFEEIDERVKSEPVEKIIKTEIKPEESPSDDPDVVEEIISIEIDAVDEDEPVDNNTVYCPPKRKRRRLQISDPVTAASDAKKLKSLLESYIGYLCPECGFEFDQQPAWREHVFNEHNLESALETSFKLCYSSNSYQCVECDQILATTKKSELQRHRFMHMPYQAYLKCTLCLKTKSSKPKILQHLQEEHAQKVENTLNNWNYNCLQCGQGFTTQARCQNHHVQCKRRDSIRKRTIRDNMKLLAHLKKARKRMHELVAQWESEK